MTPADETTPNDPREVAAGILILVVVFAAGGVVGFLCGLWAG